MRLVVGVLAIQGDVREHVHALESVGASAVPVRSLPDLECIDGLVIPGGESTVISRLAIIDGLLEPIRAAIWGGMPAYGSCAGMIMLAGEVLDGRADQQTFGGLDITVRRNAFGRQVDSFETLLQLEGIADSFPGVFIRAPWVERVGDSVTVLGRVDGAEGDGRIVAVRQRNLLATSFHPELTGDTRVHAYFTEMVRQAR